MAMTLDGSNGVTFNDSSLQGAAASPFGLKNRIINGDCRIDQRNAGASITANDNTYAVDRWVLYASQSSKLTAQQNQGSVTPPAGFKNYLGYTSSSAYTVGASEYFSLTQAIEGFNVADLAWGTANAKTVTVSFWVRSSLTGTFGGALRNADVTRTYPFSYTISAANTWEYKTITIAGDTSGTWNTTNGYGLAININLGAGSTVSGTAGAWASAFYCNASSTVNLVATNGATFYITGVQLEVGSTATPFERRMYGQELALCQRYYQRSYTGATYGSVTWQGYCVNTVWCFQSFLFPVQMRATPTMSYTNVINAPAFSGVPLSIDVSSTAFVTGQNCVSTNNGAYWSMNYIASAEL